MTIAFHLVLIKGHAYAFEIVKGSFELKLRVGFRKVFKKDVAEKSPFLRMLHNCLELNLEEARRP